MRRRRTVRFALAFALAVLVGACSSDDDADPASTTGADGASETSVSSNTWATELEDGSLLTVELDVPADDPRVAPFVAFRDEAGVTDAVTWIAAQVEVPADVADGQGSGRYLTFVEEGRNPLDDDPDDPTDGIVIADFACGELDEWFAATTTDDVDALNTTYGEIFSGTCGGQTLGVPAPSGETTPYVLVVSGDEVPGFAELYAGLATTLSPAG